MIFTWSSTNADYCIGTNSFPISGKLATSGSTTQRFSNPGQGLGYGIQCYTSNSEGSDFKLLTITITSAPTGGTSPPPSGSSGGGGGAGVDWVTLLLLSLILPQHGRHIECFLAGGGAGEPSAQLRTGMKRTVDSMALPSCPMIGEPSLFAPQMSA